MIVIEPASLLASLAATSGTSPGRAAAVGKRELSSFLARAAKEVGVKGHISVLLTDDRTIRRLNRQFRNQDKATDVLSFSAAVRVGSGRKGAALAGDVAISLETAARQAAAFGHALESEVKVLLLHGVLHLAGLDHETDSGEMARQERGFRKRLGLPLGLIQRSVATAGRAPAKKVPAEKMSAGAAPKSTTSRTAVQRKRSARL